MCIGSWRLGLLVLAGCGRVGFGGSDAGSPATDAATDAAIDAATDAVIDAGPVANRVFVTSTRVNGAFGGQAVADTACRDRALEAGLTGTFVAFVAAPNGNPVDRLAGSRGWVRVDGKPVYDTVADLMTRGAVYPISLDEQGRSVSGGVWTGTNEDGTLGSSTCLGWTTGAAGESGLFGSSTATSWTAIRYVFQACAVAASFLCFETGRSVPVPPPASSTTGRILFVARTMWAGGSLASADAVCATEATAAGVIGTFRALLATTGQPPAARLASLSGPWRRADGVRLTTGALGAAALEISANVGADGAYLPPSSSFSRAWTGAPDLMTPGTAASTCVDWSSTAGAGIGGEIAETALTAFGHLQFGQTCGTTAFLYCAQD